MLRRTPLLVSVILERFAFSSIEDESVHHLTINQNVDVLRVPNPPSTLTFWVSVDTRWHHAGHKVFFFPVQHYHTEHPLK